MHRVAERKTAMNPETSKTMALEETRQMLPATSIRQIQLEMLNVELAFQNEEKEKRAAELVIANKLVLQEAEKFRIVADFTYDWEEWRAPDGTMLYVSPSCERITGHTAAEFMADPNLLVKIAHPDDQAKISAHLHEAQEQQSMEFDFRILTPGGKIRWIGHACHAVYNEAGEWLGRRASNRDSTEHKLTAETLERSKSRLSNIIEATNIGSWEWNVQTGETVFNEAWAQIIGYTLDELAPVSITTWEKLVHPADLKQSDLLLERHFAGELPYYDYECRMKHKDGRWVWIHDRGRVITRTGDGKPLMMFGTHAELTKSNAYLENLINYAHAPIIVWDSNFRITRFNHAFELLTGRSEAEVLNQTPEMFFPPELAENSLALIRRTVAGDRWEAVGIDILHKDGTTRAVLWNSATLFAPDGKTPIATIAQGQDITALKERESELINAKERAEESDRLKTAFLKNLSHEIRTPFNGILGLLAILQNEDDLPVSDRDKYISMINQSANRLMKTINDTVEIAKIQTGQVKVKLVEANITSLSRDLFEQFKPHAELKGLKFTLNNSLSTVDCGIKVDDDKLNTALGNLFDNAIKFTQTGAVEFGIRRHADCLEFSIKDTGIGISVNNQHSIFNIFMQEDASDTRKYEGSGLGLPIAQAYVKMLGGDIRLESQEGQGSTFYVTFPLGGGGIKAADKQRFAK
jgi:PAS domain S-box-containing protein